MSGVGGGPRKYLIELLINFQIVMRSLAAIYLRLIKLVYIFPVEISVIHSSL